MVRRAKVADKYGDKKSAPSEARLKRSLGAKPRLRRVLFGRDVHGNGAFAGAALEEERATAWVATLDHDGDAGLAGADHDFRHDHAGGNIGGDINQHTTTGSGGGDGEGERLLFPRAQHDG